MEPDGTYEPGFVGIRFCQECNNMLYPKEDKENRILLYAVSASPRVPRSSPPVYRSPLWPALLHVIPTHCSAPTGLGLTSDYPQSDPTLPSCPSLK